MTAHRPTNEELAKWRAYALRIIDSSPIYSGDTARIRDTCGALLEERAEHTATKARLNQLIDAIDAVRDEVQYDEEVGYCNIPLAMPWRGHAERAILALLKAQSAA